VNLALLFAAVSWFVWFCTRRPKKYSTTEWREAMRKKGLGCK
jgi:hypothetical protein